MGNDVEVSNATLRVDAGALVYTWSHDGALVLQMTNITPWGEEGRAVRTVLRIAN